MRLDLLRKLGATALILAGIVLLPVLTSLMLQPGVERLCGQGTAGVDPFDMVFNGWEFILCAFNGAALGWTLRGAGLRWSLLAPTLEMLMIAVLLQSISFLTISLEYPMMLVFSALGAVVGHCARVVATVRLRKGTRQKTQDPVDDEE